MVLSARDWIGARSLVTASMGALVADTSAVEAGTAVAVSAGLADTIASPLAVATVGTAVFGNLVGITVGDGTRAATVGVTGTVFGIVAHATSSIAETSSKHGRHSEQVRRVTSLDQL